MPAYRKKPPNAVQPIIRDLLVEIDKMGWTDNEVAAAAGLSRSYLCQLRRGKRHDPSLVCIEALAGVLGKRLSLKTSGRPRKKLKIITPLPHRRARYASDPSITGD